MRAQSGDVWVSANACAYYACPHAYIHTYACAAPTDLYFDSSLGECQMPRPCLTVIFEKIPFRPPRDRAPGIERMDGLVVD
jgi:hypothetical protein